MAPPHIIESPYAGQLDVPYCDVLSYIFSSKPSPKHQAQFFNADNPSLSFDLPTAELYVKQFGKGLQNLGLQPGDKVLLVSHNQLFFPVVIWGVLAAQCVFTGASPSASVFELSHQLKDSEAKLILTAPDQLKTSIKAANKVGLSPDRIFLFDQPFSGASTSGGSMWTDLWVSPEEARDWKWNSITTRQNAQETTAVINYSSGTTGLPKGVELSHFNLVSNVQQLIFKRSIVANTKSDLGRVARLDESGERWLAPLPMYHAFGQTYYSMLAPRLGAKVFVMGKFNSVKYLTYIDIYRITFINVVPALLETLLKLPNSAQFNLKSLLMVGSGSAPLDLNLARQFEKNFLRPGVSVKQGWGMTETTCNVTGFAPGDEDDGSSIGWLNPSCVARIVEVPDRDFANIERSKGVKVGEIWVSGPNIMKGYLKRPQETADTTVNEGGYRWLRTGDVGYADSRGCLFIVDRIKELIKVKGLQVSPAEIEKTLKSHGGVLDAAVTCAKLNGHEFPRAFVVRKDSSVTADDLHAHVQTKLARHKWLEGGIFFLDDLPRTSSGKIIKRLLPTPEKERRSKL
ncbi:hypothetical protein EDB81DRAFT_663834 [Dactylonectria macrodidyma]|uniref:Acetyl-CoA synthetase-like protein n=1 Tax=Dactylonectria macrodidyma TaxID=307937 RepID=A0A9P9IMQ2_9HYPO|nr:hypothetical protein EDB81DRAFT_663834 [Dactylonectria macrodidyma]